MFWIDVFTRPAYFALMADALDYCSKHKSMEIFAYCIMPSHVHLIYRSKTGNPAGLLRDIKGFTSRKLVREIENDSQESRKEWLLEMFEKAAKENAKVSSRQFWQQHNKPIEIWSAPVFRQKLDYIHNNPVRSGFVTQPEDWKYSSARNYICRDQSVLEIDLMNDT